MAYRNFKRQIESGFVRVLNSLLNSIIRNITRKYLTIYCTFVQNVFIFIYEFSQNFLFFFINLIFNAFNLLRFVKNIFTHMNKFLNNHYFI